MFYNHQAMKLPDNSDIYAEFDVNTTKGEKTWQNWGFTVVNSQVAKPVYVDRCPCSLSIQAMEWAFDRKVGGIFWMTNYNYLPIIKTLNRNYHMEQVCFRNNFYPYKFDVDYFDGLVGFDQEPRFSNYVDKTSQRLYDPLPTPPEWVAKVDPVLRQNKRLARQKLNCYTRTRVVPWKKDSAVFILGDPSLEYMFHRRPDGKTLVMMDGSWGYATALKTLFQEFLKLTWDFTLMLFIHKEDEDKWVQEFNSALIELRPDQKADYEFRYVPEKAWFTERDTEWYVGKRWAEMMIVEEAIKRKYTDNKRDYAGLFFVSQDTSLSPIAKHMKHSTDYTVYNMGPKKIAMGHEMYLVHFDFYY